MSVVLQLTKQHYYRPDGAYGDNFHYVLKDDVVNWLLSQGIKNYKLFWQDYKGEDFRNYLGCYLQFPDHSHAMMFKLTWL
jgi:hypothetical protein